MSRKGGLPLVLEIGLCALIVVAPLPFGSVGPAGRDALELLALALTVLWGVAAMRGPVALPPRVAVAAVLGLVGICALQLMPVGRSTVSALSPHAAELVGGLDPPPPATLSLAPAATASALRTGAALAGALFVACSVVAARGARRLALAALISAAFQGLYGILVLASGHDMIWNQPKTAYLDSATGTFVNRNHFAGFLAATLPLGVGVVIAAGRRARRDDDRKAGWLAAVGPQGSRAMLAGLCVLVGAAGLLLSFSRAGTALGLFAIVGTVAVALRGPARHRLAIGLCLIAVAAIPLIDLGADRLVDRYAASGEDLRGTGGRLDVAQDALRMIAAFPSCGAGFGAFNWAYPAFSSPRVRLHYTHAHDDLLQLGVEGGLPALILFGCLAFALAPAIVRAARDGRDPVVTGAAFGLCALLLHGLVDFNFHIPANAAIAAVLAGVLFGASWNDPS